jgi:hypothetical protein
VEKERYLKALRALVDEKGNDNMTGSSIPCLCSCGQGAAGNKDMSFDPQLCAANCVFYKNSKAYERALRDVLHSISLFK